MTDRISSWHHTSTPAVPPRGGSVSPQRPGLWVTLEAVPNLDFRPGTHQRTIRIRAKVVEVGNLTEAVKTVLAFIAEYELGAGNLSSQAGLVTRDGKALCRVSLNGRLWKVGPDGHETRQPFEGEQGGELGCKSPAGRMKRPRRVISTQGALSQAEPGARAPLAKTAEVY